MTDIPDGYAFVEGRGRRYAQAALDAASAADLDTALVRAIEGGFLIPADAADHYVDPDADPADVTYVDGSKPPVGDDGLQVLEERTPTEDWKNADIAAWAEDHDVDLGGATKKADMLAAIDAASNKEG